MSDQKPVKGNWNENLTLISKCPGRGPLAALEMPDVHPF